TLLDRFTSIREELEARLVRAQTDLELHTAVEMQLRELDGARDEEQKARELHSRLEQALELVRKKRLEFTQKVLDETADECNRLYSQIHPGEPLGQVQLQMERRASLDTKAQFGALDSVPPQAY